MPTTTPETTRDGLNRRTVLTAAAWTLPAVALAASAPAFAASDEPTGVACVVVPAASFTTSGTIYVDGQNGVPHGTPAYFGAPTRTTGWTPIDANDPAHIDGDWWRPAGLNTSTDVGFMSQDDYDNSVDPGANPPATTITGVFRIMGVTAGSTYDLAMPVYGGSDWLGAQFLNITVSGAGVTETVVAGYRGTKSLSVIPSEYDSYGTHIPDSTNYLKRITATTDGILEITYTFSLVYTPGGSRQNADIAIGLPTVTNCVAVAD